MAEEQGFEVVHYEEVTAENLPEAVNGFAEAVEGNDVPSDGLVLTFDDIAYGEALGRTAKFPATPLHLSGRMKSGDKAGLH